VIVQLNYNNGQTSESGATSQESRFRMGKNSYLINLHLNCSLRVVSAAQPS